MASGDRSPVRSTSHALSAPVAIARSYDHRAGPATDAGSAALFAPRARRLSVYTDAVSSGRANDQRIVAASPIPLYHQISRVLRTRIVSGTYAVGARLCSEDELASEFRVSKATVRQAVGELVRDGLLSREQGRGTFVLDVPKNKFGVTFRADLDELINNSRTTTSERGNIDLQHGIELPPNVANSLGVSDGRGTRVQRVLFSGGVPFAYHLNFLPDQYGRLIHSKDLASSGVVFLLATRATVARARQIISARFAEHDVCNRLRLSFGSAVLTAERFLYDDDGRLIEVNRAWYPSDVYQFVVEFERRSGDDTAE